MKTVAATLLLTVACLADSLVYIRIPEEQLQARLNAPPSSQAERLTLLRKHWKDSECEGKNLIEQKVPGEDSPNLICTIHGRSPETVLVIAPSDYKVVTPKKSLADWAALDMLALLPASVKPVRHNYTFVFAALTGSAHGHAGAIAYLDSLTPEQRKNLRAVIDIEQIGRTPATYGLVSYGEQIVAAPRRAPVAINAAVQSHESSALEELLQLSSRVLNQPTNDMPRRSRDLSFGEAQPFHEDGLPVMTVQSLKKWPAAVLTVSGLPAYQGREQVNLHDFDNTYRLLCVDLLYLDRQFDKLTNHPPAPLTEMAEATEAPTAPQPNTTAIAAADPP